MSASISTTKTPFNLKLLALGGLGQIGMNLMTLEMRDKILIIDVGVLFPDYNVLGFDYLVPNFDYLVENQEKIAGIIITHGHEDHVGALPFLMNCLNVPAIYASPFTAQLIAHKFSEYQPTHQPEIKHLKHLEWIEIEGLEIEPFEVCHSIPGAMGFSLNTSQGKVVFTGDFRFDDNPMIPFDNEVEWLQHMSETPTFLLMSDSTNINSPGKSTSEQDITPELLKLMHQANGLVIVTCFSSNVGRIKQVLEAADKLSKKVGFLGKSLVRTSGIAKNMGILEHAESLVLPIDKLLHLPREQIVIIASGCQGENRSHLKSISLNEHKHVRLQEGDTIVFSSRVIPGNEKNISYLVNDLYRQKATVITQKEAVIHTSGHGHREELSLVIEKLQPQLFLPIHGEYQHLIKHRQLAMELGLTQEQIIEAQNGDLVELTEEEIDIVDKIETSFKFIETGNFSSLPLYNSILEPELIRDRRTMANNGFVAVQIQINQKEKTLVRTPVIRIWGLISTIQTNRKDLIATLQKELENSLTEDILKLPEDELIEEIRILSRRHFRKSINKKPLVTTFLQWT